MELKNLIIRLLEKDPNHRFAIEEMRSHPWITKFNGIIKNHDPCIENSQKNIGTNGIA